MAHNPKVEGSNPSPATKRNQGLSEMLGPFSFADCAKFVLIGFIMAFSTLTALAR